METCKSWLCFCSPPVVECKCVFHEGNWSSDLLILVKLHYTQNCVSAAHQNPSHYLHIGGYVFCSGSFLCSQDYTTTTRSPLTGHGDGLTPGSGQNITFRSGLHSSGYLEINPVAFLFCFSYLHQGGLSVEPLDSTRGRSSAALHVNTHLSCI